jgi:hypothetical protein
MPPKKSTPQRRARSESSGEGGSDTDAGFGAPDGERMPRLQRAGAAGAGPKPRGKAAAAAAAAAAAPATPATDAEPAGRASTKARRSVPANAAAAAAAAAPSPAVDSAALVANVFMEAPCGEAFLPPVAFARPLFNLQLNPVEITERTTGGAGNDANAAAAAKGARKRRAGAGDGDRVYTERAWHGTCRVAVDIPGVGRKPVTFLFNVVDAQLQQ